jgi:hypothetical protein
MHIDELGKPLCPCNFYKDKHAEAKLRHRSNPSRARFAGLQRPTGPPGPTRESRSRRW